MPYRTLDALLERLPHPEIPGPPADSEPVRVAAGEARALVNAALSRLLPHSDTALISSDPTTPSTIAIYRIQYAAGALLVGGVYKRFAAADDVIFLGAGATLDAYALDGSAAAVLTADGQTCWAALCAIVVDGAVQLVVVLGDEAADGAEVAPDAQAISDALVAAEIADHQPKAGGLVLARWKVQREAVDTITYTHTDPASNDALAGERAAGSLFAVVAPS